MGGGAEIFSVHPCQSSFFLFFKAGIISSLESLFKSFCGGGSQGARGVHWVSWDSICHPKECGCHILINGLP